MSLWQQRCALHPEREAVACCPACKRHFCRECVTEHDGRVLCAACIGSLMAAGAARPRTRPLAALARCAAKACAWAGSLLMLWLFYMLVATLLGAIPHRFHNGSVLDTVAEEEE